MAGGTWTSQNKVLPGVYINTLSQGNLNAGAGERGTVAIAEPLSWGPSGVVQTVIPGDNTVPYIGYDITHEKALFLREMVKGSDTTSGPVKILLYRLKGTGGAKAAATIGGLTATALYDGLRGNDITVMVSGDPDQEGILDVVTVVDGTVADEQSVAAISELHGNSWVEFSGSGELEESAGQSLSGGKDPTVGPADYAAFLTAIEPYQFDILVYDGTDNTVIQAIAAFVKRISERVGLKCQAVMAEAQGCNSEWVISVNNGVKLSNGTVLTAQQATWWLGGAQAGARYNQSLTYAQYPDAVEALPKLSDTESELAVQSGEIVFIDNFDTVKVCSDINTLTSFTTVKHKEYSKNRVMRVLNQFCNDAYKQYSLYYIGKTDNNEEGRSLFKAWLVDYLGKMQKNNGIQNFVPDDISVLPGEESDAVLINSGLQPVDSVEKIYMTVPVSDNIQTE